MNARPYVVRRDAELEALRAAALPALVAWARDWGCSGTPTVHCAAADTARLPATGLPWLAGDGAAAVWLSTDADFSERLAATLFRLDDGSRRSGLAASVAAQARESLQGALAKALSGMAEGRFGEPAPLPAEAGRRGSGAVLLNFSFGDIALQALVPYGKPAAATAPGAAKPACEPVAAALEAFPVQVALQVGELVMSLGSLNSLTVGDVIRLPTRLDEPLKLTAAGGRVVCHAYVGTTGGHRAVELLAKRG